MNVLKSTGQQLVEGIVELLQQCIDTSSAIKSAITPDARRRLVRILALWLVYKLVVRRWLDRHPKLTFNTKAPIPSFLANRMTTLRKYVCTPYLLSGVVQTVFTGIRGAHLDISHSIKFREVVHLSELIRPSFVMCSPPVVPPGIVSIDWVLPASEADWDTSNAPVVVLVPGLTGGSGEVYIRTMATELCKQGIRVACYSPRGRGGNELASPFFYSGGWVLDLSRVVTRIRSRVQRGTKVFGVGFSLGSNYLAKMVGEFGDRCELDGAIMLACPVDMPSMMLEMRGTIQGRLMDPILVNMLKVMMEDQVETIAQHPLVDIEAMRQSTTLSEFDHRVTAKMMGLACGSDYYRYASCSLNFHQIRRPCIFIHARNDPICPGHVIRMDNFQVNPYLLHVMTEEGGHSMTWPTGLTAESWAAKVVCEAVQVLNSDEFDAVVTSSQKQNRS